MAQPKPGIWNQISSGSSPSIFLAFDFHLSSRREAGFRDLVKLFPEPLNVFQTAQPSGSLSVGSSPEGYLDWWCEGIRGQEPRVGAVLGYCAGSLFAAGMADRIDARTGVRPAVIFLNPEKPSVATVSRDFNGLIATMSSLTPFEKEAALHDAGLASKAAADEFDTVASELMRLHERYCSIVFERMNI
jgi:hypothetical protein